MQNGPQYEYLYDGKGNVSSVIDANQNIAASYAYNPFGRLLAKSGTLDQPYMFSTKPDYQVYGKIYFGYRWYDLSCMKWMTRDPSGEENGLNLYGFAKNSPINNVDELGLFVVVRLYPHPTYFHHIGIGFDTFDTSGFYWIGPSGIFDDPVALPELIAGKSEPGQWEEDIKDPPINSLILTTNDCQEEQMRSAYNISLTNHGDYNLYNNNCATQVWNILANGGINVDYTYLPNTLFDELWNYQFSNP